EPQQTRALFGQDERLPPSITFARTQHGRLCVRLKLWKPVRAAAFNRVEPNSFRDLRSPDMYYIVVHMSEHTLGDFEFAVLLTLSTLEDAYGAVIQRALSERLQREVAVGAVYTTLQRLEDKALLRSWMSEATPVRGGRARRCYALLPAATRALRASRLARERLLLPTSDRLRPA
ncbi:MAG: helix-turn-helix transcriptional regulator, partial [Gemmatimonas sp.]